MNIVQAGNKGNDQSVSVGTAIPGQSCITSRDVDQMDAAQLAAAMQSGRTLSITGRKLAEIRKLLPN